MLKKTLAQYEMDGELLPVKKTPTEKAHFPYISFANMPKKFIKKKNSLM